MSAALGLACAQGGERHPTAASRASHAPARAAAAPGPGAGTCDGRAGERGAPAFRWPVNGAVTSSFGGRGQRFHRGIDIAARYGTVVRAAAPGTVIFSGRKRNYGRVVIVSHEGGYSTVYAHNQDNFAMRGARVNRGDELAEVGTTGNSTGPHLHFEVRLDDRPLDPLSCLPVRATR